MAYSIRITDTNKNTVTDIPVPVDNDQAAYDHFEQEATNWPSTHKLELSDFGELLTEGRQSGTADWQ
jgi:hypothetical protein